MGISEFVQRIVAELGSSLSDAVLSAFWLWVGGFSAGLLVSVLAYLRGVRGRAVWFLFGTVFGIGLMVVLTGLLFWWREAFYVGTTALFGGALLRTLWVLRQRERERLGKYQKGYFNYARDFRRGNKQFLRAMSALTKETEFLGNKAGTYTKMLTDSPLSRFEQYGEFVAWRAANTFRKSARRYSRHGLAFRSANETVGVSIEGVLGFFQQTQNVAQMKAIGDALGFMREAASGAVAQQERFAVSVLETPDMSQTYNAARAELHESILHTLETLRANVTFCERTLARIKA